MQVICHLTHSCPTGRRLAEDIGDLEGYVRATSVMLFFLSKKYFGSRNCLKEIRAMLRLRLVHRNTASRGLLFSTKPLGLRYGLTLRDADGI